MTGKSWSFTAKNQISKMPRRNEGNAVPVRASTADPASNIVSFFMADNTPKGTPTRIAKRSEKEARVSVTGNASLKA